MLKNKTVFVVGAGASVEFGFPLGWSLKTAIADKLLKSEFDKYNRGTAVEHAIFAISEGNPAVLASYKEAAMQIVSGMPVALSIDNFLHSRQDDVNINLIGKLGIAAEILSAERRSVLYAPSSNEFSMGEYYDGDKDVNLGNRKQDFIPLPDSWLGKLVTLLFNGVLQRDCASVFDNAYFIIFNYDRSVEHYLWYSLQQYFGISSSRAAGILNNGHFYHPYGTVGKLPWQDGALHVERFGHSYMYNNLIDAAKGIKTFTESVGSGGWNELHRIFSGARRLIFLGFGYIEQNIELFSNDNHSSIVEVYGTAFGLSSDSCIAVQGDIGSALNLSRDYVHVHSDLKCPEFLDYYFHRLSR